MCERNNNNVPTLWTENDNGNTMVIELKLGNWNWNRNYFTNSHTVTLALSMVSLGFLLLGARTAYLVDIWFTNDFAGGR